ncbi:MAG: aspartate carbamoyltransferase catalytic subunit [Deltaproteobacteria bacterium]|nr:aspartate carbamoyltransferase catalytic subunit [Deltaproteobacteria bacterium]
MTKPFKHRHLLGIELLDRDDIELILDTAVGMSEIGRRRIKKVPALRGMTIVNFFAEPSTRTKLSFEVAEKRLSADSLSLAASSSSLTKGESLLDTVKNIMAMSPDVVILRHRISGAPHHIAEHIDAAVINAGDGTHEHPTQALLDAYTIRERLGRLEGLRILLCGDIAHSRVARSNMLLLRKMGAEVTVFGPYTMIPMGVEEAFDVKLHRGSLEEALSDKDVVMMLRIQKERLGEPLLPSDREYSMHFGLTMKHLAHVRPQTLVMHPGPVNRGVELAPEVADSDRSVILEQVENGVAVRMAILYLLCRPGEAADG